MRRVRTRAATAASSRTRSCASPTTTSHARCIGSTPPRISPRETSPSSFQVTGDPDIRQGNGAPGTGTLLVNGDKVGEVNMDVTVPLLFSIEGLSVGHDYGDSVDHENYRPTFPFTGSVKQVAFDLSGDAIKDAEAETRRGMSHQ